MGIKEIMKPKYDGIRLNVSIISDVHFDKKHPTPEVLYERTGAGFKDMQASESPVDLMAIPGDTTSHGNEENWNMFVETLQIARPAKDILVNIGNHDTWGEDDVYGRYYRMCELTTGHRPDKVYFTRVFGGYTFICIGSEKDVGCGAYISDEQIAFLDEELKKATKDGKPTFVFCHQSLNQKHGLPETWDSEYDPDRDPDEGGIGKRSDEVEAVLKKYKNVFYISGHSHMGMCGEKSMKGRGFSSFEDDGTVHLLNMPSYNCGNHHGECNSFGVGVQVEIYDDKVLMRARNYIKGEWLPQFDHEYAIV